MVPSWAFEVTVVIVHTGSTSAGRRTVTAPETLWWAMRSGCEPDASMTAEPAIVFPLNEVIGPVTVTSPVAVVASTAPR